MSVNIDNNVHGQLFNLSVFKLMLPYFSIFDLLSIHLSTVLLNTLYNYLLKCTNILSNYNFTCVSFGANLRKVLWKYSYCIQINVFYSKLPILSSHSLIPSSSNLVQWFNGPLQLRLKYRSWVQGMNPCAT